MNTAVLLAIITNIAAIIGIFATYYLTKKREREAEWRKEKLEYYKAFVDSISGIIVGEATSENQVIFSKSRNNLLLFAPKPVIKAVNAYVEGTRVGAKASDEQHDRLLSEMLNAIRHDLGVATAFDGSFKATLWASGVRSETTKLIIRD